MTIICIILRFFGKEFFDRSLIQQRSTYNSQHFVGILRQFEVTLIDCYHAIDKDCRVYLDYDSNLCCTSIELDFEMLLNPLKEVSPDVHQMSDIPSDCQGSQFKTSHSFIRSLSPYYTYNTAVFSEQY